MTAYTAIMVTAVVVGGILARRTQRDLGLTRLERLGIGVGAFCGAMLGAKLPYVLASWPEPPSFNAWFSDGKTILLGLAGGYAGVEVAKWSLEVRTRTGDTFAAPVAVAIAIGRVGCFVGGCCYGTPTTLPWGVVFDSIDGTPRHPTQLYEAAFHALCAVGLAWAARHGWWRGHLMKAYIVVYSAYRFLTEFIRPEWRAWGGLTGYQWASLTLIIAFGGLWLFDARRRNSLATPTSQRQESSHEGPNAK